MSIWYLFDNFKYWYSKINIWGSIFRNMYWNKECLTFRCMCLTLQSCFLIHLIIHISVPFIARYLPDSFYAWTILDMWVTLLFCRNRIQSKKGGISRPDKRLCGRQHCLRVFCSSSLTYRKLITYKGFFIRLV